jgi:hypothetical protein
VQHVRGPINEDLYAVVKKEKKAAEEEEEKKTEGDQEEEEAEAKGDEAAEERKVDEQLPAGWEKHEGLQIAASSFFVNSVI